VHTKVKPLTERNPIIVGAVGIAITGALVLLATQYSNLPIFNSDKHYSALFAEAGGLTAGAPVQVAGYQVGKVSDVSLDGARVKVSFTVEKSIRLGDRTEAAIKTKTLLGARMVEVSPRGDNQLSDTIPLDRTTSPYELPEVLGDVSRAIGGLDTDQLNKSLTTLATEFQGSAPALRDVMDGVGRFSRAINQRDTELRGLLDYANRATGVLSQRSDQIVSLVTDTDSLLGQLRTQRSALDGLLTDVTALSQQLSGLVAENRTQLGPALEKVNNVLAILDKNKVALQQSVQMASNYSAALGEAVASGPFFKGYLANLVPGQFLQPFIDAAFSDLGVDPATLLPSQLTDPQTGQVATPALPVPFPRTGQGGDPALTVPDAIIGNPGDPRYPYREPLPQPPAGGPPPGPPAGFDPSAPAQITSAPTSVEVGPTPYLPPIPTSGATP
jgi:phospholipid/cholesterol/gamma-HCH transport system substrate-binding protein